MVKRTKKVRRSRSLSLLKKSKAKTFKVSRGLSFAEAYSQVSKMMGSKGDFRGLKYDRKTGVAKAT
jgi:hypothetical protein